MAIPILVGLAGRQLLTSAAGKAAAGMAARAGASAGVKGVMLRGAANMGARYGLNTLLKSAPDGASNELTNLVTGKAQSAPKMLKHAEDMAVTFGSATLGRLAKLVPTVPRLPVPTLPLPGINLGPRP